MFDLVNRILTDLHLLEHQKSFVDLNLKDAVLVENIGAPWIDNKLKHALLNEDDRIRFKTAFSNLVRAQREVPPHYSPRQSGALNMEQQTDPPNTPGRPLQIMRFENDYSGSPLKVRFNEAALESITRKTGNRRVAVKAVAGPTRNGKSFYLNLFLRRLMGLVNKEMDWMGWTHDTAPLTGFVWKANVDHVTDGIWMWSEPFTVTSREDGSSFDIILMDTQGVFDDSTGKREWSILMGLSLLTSSCLVYNTTSNVDENDLHILSDFLSFGLMALEDTNNIGREKPFQSLVFLVRDWSNPGEYAYGSEDGQAFIDMKLRKKDTHQDDNSFVRENIRKCFDSISCTLLPHPGPEVLKTNYDGSIANCRTFAAAIESSIDELLLQGGIPTKRMNGNQLTGPEILRVFKIYVDMFNRNVTAGTIYYATCKACNTAIVNRCFTNCVSRVEKKLEDEPFALEREMDEYLAEEKKLAMEEFEISSKMGSRRVINEADDALCKDLQEALEKIKSEYFSQITIKVAAAHEQAIGRYETAIEATLHTGREFLTEAEFEHMSDSAQNEALALFKTILSATNTQITEPDVATLTEVLQLKCQEFQRQNDEKRLQAEVNIQNEVDVFSQEYNAAMNARISGRLFTQETMMGLHDKVSSSVENEFTGKYFGSLFHSAASQLLKSKLTDEGNILQEKMARNVQEANERANGLVDEALEKYTSELSAQTDLDPSEFEQSERRIHESAKIGLNNSMQELPEELKLVSINTLISKTREVYNAFLHSIYKNTIQIDRDISTAKETVRSTYETSLRSYCDQNHKIFLNDPSKLEERHGALKLEAVSDFEEVLKSLNIHSPHHDVQAESVHLSTSLNGVFQRQLEVNARKEIEAEKDILGQVDTFLEQYKCAMKASFEGQVVSEAQLQLTHEKSSQHCLEDFAKFHTNSLLYSKGEEALVEQINASFSQFLSSTKSANAQLNTDGSNLVSQISAAYNHKLKGKVGNQSEMEDCHVLWKEEAIDTLRDAFGKHQHHYKEFEKKLISEIDTTYRNHLQQMSEIVASIVEAHNDVIRSYIDSMETLMTASEDAVDDATLILQHNVYKDIATGNLKISYKTLSTQLRNHKGAEQEGCAKLGELLKEKLIEYQQRNRNKISRMETALEGEVNKYVEQYATEMDNEIGDQLPLGGEINSFHGDASKRAVEDFETALTAIGLGKSSVWMTRGIKILVERINAHKQTLCEEIQRKTDGSRREGEALVKQAVETYKENMMSCIDYPITEFTEAQNLNAAKAVELLQWANNPAIHKTHLPTLIDEVNEAVERTWTEMINLREEADRQLLTFIEDATTLYAENIHTIFLQNSDPIGEEELQSHHILSSTAAETFLKNKCREIRLNSHSIQKFEEIALSQLSPRITAILAQFTEEHVNRRIEAQQHLEAQITRLASNYTMDMLLKVDDATMTKDELERLHLQTREKCMETFYLRNSTSHSIQEDQKKLRERLNSEFSQFSQRLAQDQESIKRAGDSLVTQAFTNYSGKILNGCNGEETDLQRCHERLRRDAIDLVRNSGKLTNTNALETYLLQLESKIDTFYQELLEGIIETNAKQERDVSQAKEYAFANYERAIKGVIRDSGAELTPVADLEQKHYSSKAESIRSLEAFFHTQVSTSKLGAKRSSALQELELEIDNLYALLRRNVQSAHDTLNSEGERLVAEALAHYTDAMATVLGGNDDAFHQSHETNKATAINKFESSKLTSHRKHYDVFMNKLQVAILEANSRLFKDHHQCRNEVGASIVKAREDASRAYEANMDSFLAQTQNDDAVPSAKLKEKHELEKSKAHQLLQQGVRVTQAGSSSNFAVAMAQAVTDLDAKLLAIYGMYKTSNAYLLQKYETRMIDHLSSLKEIYKSSLRNTVEATTDVAQLERVSAAKASECLEELRSKINPQLVSPRFIPDLVQQLQDFIRATDVEYHGVLLFRIQFNESTVNRLLTNAARYYNEQMSRFVLTEPWFESEVLSEKNDQLISAAIDHCRAETTITEAQERQLRADMAVLFVKYSEDNTLRTPVDNPAIGIDLGTTYSCVAVCIAGQVHIIPDREVDNGATLPSYVAFNADGTISVGEPAKNQAFSNPENTIFDAKRLIGRRFLDPIVQEDMKLWPFTVVEENSWPTIQVGGRAYRPEEISAKILLKIKGMAEDYLRKTVTEAVVTVPAYFNNAQRQATRDAAEIAGLKVKILNEPTAAAIAYKLQRADELRQRNVLIFDLGGGTFDVAVLEIGGQNIKVLATGGDTHLGGEDFDNAIVNCIIERVKKDQDGRDLARGRNSRSTSEKAGASKRLRRLRDRCEAAKRNLSSTTSTVIAIDMIDGDFSLLETLTREEFENLNIAHFKKCIDVVKKSLVDAKLKKTEIDDIVLVGGSTRIPKIQQLLKEFFDNEKELCSTIHPEEAVARGAAIQAALLHGQQTLPPDSVRLSDVTPLSLGTEVVDGSLSVIIPRNTPVPCKRTKTFVTVNDNQTAIDFEIYEGENLQVAKNNNFLGKFVLNGIPKGPARHEEVDCTMTIDDEGILHIKAVSKSNKKEGDITITSYNGGMTREQINRAKAARD